MTLHVTKKVTCWYGGPLKANSYEALCGHKSVNSAGFLSLAAWRDHGIGPPDCEACLLLLLADGKLPQIRETEYVTSPMELPKELDEFLAYTYAPDEG